MQQQGKYIKTDRITKNKRRRPSNGEGGRVHRNSAAAIPPQPAAAQLAAAQQQYPPQQRKQSAPALAPATARASIFVFFNFGTPAPHSFRRVLRLLLLRSAYAATAQARSAPSTPGARHLERGGLTTRRRRRCCCCCCYDGVVELE